MEVVVCGYTVYCNTYIRIIECDQLTIDGVVNLSLTVENRVFLRNPKGNILPENVKRFIFVLHYLLSVGTTILSLE